MLAYLLTCANLSYNLTTLYRSQYVQEILVEWIGASITAKMSSIYINSLWSLPPAYVPRICSNHLSRGLVNTNLCNSRSSVAVTERCVSFQRLNVITEKMPSLKYEWIPWYVSDAYCSVWVLGWIAACSVQWSIKEHNDAARSYQPQSDMCGRCSSVKRN